MCADQAAKAAANLLARTRLRAPCKVGFSPRVEGRMRAEGKPRRTLLAIVSVKALSIRSQARAISPPTTTASGLKPMMRFEMPTPSCRAVSTRAAFACASPASALSTTSIKVVVAGAPDNFVYRAIAARSEEKASQQSGLPHEHGT